MTVSKRPAPVQSLGIRTKDYAPLSLPPPRLRVSEEDTMPMVNRKRRPSVDGNGTLLDIPRPEKVCGTVFVTLDDFVLSLFHCDSEEISLAT